LPVFREITGHFPAFHERLQKKMTIDQAFNQAAGAYDAWVRKALPGYDTLFTVATEIIPFDVARPIRVLDLGAGTGLFAWHVLQKYPQARCVLVDLAEQMLAVAQSRFQAYPDQFEARLEDYRSFQDEQPFDLVISSLSIHHLSDLDKQALFQSIYTLLSSGGMFINVDQVRGETPALAELYWSAWLRHVRQNGASEAEIEVSIARRRQYDQEATLADQLLWLQQAGFTDVDCVYKHYFVAVFMGRKP
jgi:tRNA (cmo5U34)-methyltransferase